MSVLPDHEIIARTERGDLAIKPFNDESVTPNGYDLRAAEVRIGASGDTVAYGTATVPPGAVFFVSTVETVTLPSDLCAQLWLRTSWARKGVLAGLGKVDAGFSGTLTFMGFNASSSGIELPIGSRFVQIVFEPLTSPAAMTYGRRSGNYQSQSGITLEPLKKTDVQGVHRG